MTTEFQQWITRNGWSREIGGTYVNRMHEERTIDELRAMYLESIELVNNLIKQLQ